MEGEERYFLVVSLSGVREGWIDGMSRKEANDYLANVKGVDDMVVIRGVKVDLRVALKDD